MSPISSPIKILTILGARPQFIKAATVSRAISLQNEKANGEIQEVIVHTGQHYDTKMSDIFFEELDIPHPDYKLECGNLNHGSMTGRMLEGIEELIIKEKPDHILVYGDTNSTLAGALAASKLQVPIAHVEAGLRSYNMAMPEEVNRILTDRVSSLLFCPTATAVENLKKEGFPYPSINKKYQRVLNVGDVMYDATLFYMKRAKNTFSLKSWDLGEKNYVLCTVHRAENTDNPKRLISIFTALQEIAKSLPVALPLHPRTQKLIKDLGEQKLLESLTILEPVSYLEMQVLEMGAKVILTDSGGMQKEAFFHRVPCVTLRNETEWVETLDLGWNQLAGSIKENILSAFYKSLDTPPNIPSSFYGCGDAATKCVEYLLSSK
jgi:UDP-GlcNAc3NAcA epimerase